MENLTAKKRIFQDAWKEKYGCVENGEKLICTLCMDVITARTYNIERHFRAKHKDVSEMTKEDAVLYIANHVEQYAKKNKFFKSFLTRNNNATLASFTVALSVCKSGKPFTDGEFLKKTFIDCSEHLFGDFANKNQIIERIKEMPLSARTVQRRVEDMAQNIDSQVKNDLLSSDIISIALDESTDINGIGRLAIIIRFASINNAKVCEELCKLSSMTDTTKGSDIFHQVQEFLKFKNVQVLNLKEKLFSITTDGAPSMRGKNVGFVKLMENELGRSLLSFHCIIHEENLFAKASTQQLKDVMDKVVLIVNKIIARSSLIHRRFKTFLEEMESKYGDLLLHSDIRWLSRGKVLQRFVDCFDEIKMFLQELGENDPEISSRKWFLRLLFLTDIMNFYNDFNQRLQGNNHTILKMYEEWKGFTMKMMLFETDIREKKFFFFTLLKREHDKEPIDEENINVFLIWISAVKNEYESRFQGFKKHGEMFKFIITPGEIEENVLSLEYFQYLKIENFSLEMIDFKNSSLWMDKFKELRKELEKTEDNHFLIISTCWASIPMKFSSLKKIAFAILSTFGSTYKCEQIFSQMKYILSKNRSRYTADNSEAIIRLKTTEYSPDLTKLASQVQHQGSH